MTAGEKRTAMGLVGAALVIRLVIAWAPLEWLLRTTLGDDPFYYFTIARSFAHGQGFTFDGVEPTNGFHPLWMAVLVPIFRVPATRAGAVHAVLTLSALFDAIGVYVLFRLLRTLGVAIAVAAAVVGLYVASPVLLSTSGPMNGLETALNVALTSTVLLWYWRARSSDAASRSVSLPLGLSSGLLLLARTDNAVLLLALYAQLLWVARRERGRRRAVMAAGALALGMLAPWVAWCQLRFGSPVAVSGRAAAYFTRQLVAAEGWTVRDYAIKAVKNLAALATYFPIFHLNTASFVRAASGNLFLVLTAGGAALGAIRDAAPFDRARFAGRLRPWLAPLLGGVAFVGIHTARAVELRGWYYIGLLPILFVVLALIVEQARRAAAVLTAIGVVVWCVSMAAGLRSRCGESAAYEMIDVVNRRVNVETVLGSWNAGLFGYFYTGGTVVNLDGLVNNRAYDEMRARSLRAYAAGRHVGYLLDAPGAIELASPYWNGGAPMGPLDVALDNRGRGACKSLALVRLP
jgi:hypothetical protein